MTQHNTLGAADQQSSEGARAAQVDGDRSRDAALPSTPDRDLVERLREWSRQLDNSADIALRKPELASTAPRLASYRDRAALLTEAAERLQHLSQWRPFFAAPASRRKIVALFNDGSGASLFYVTDLGDLLDAEGDPAPSLDDGGYGAWTYLPDGFRLWCELREDDPVNLPPPPQKEPDQ